MRHVLVSKHPPKQLLKTIVKFKPTFMPLIPTMYIAMFKDPDINKRCISGSAPLPVKVIKDTQKELIKYCKYKLLTETEFIKVFPKTIWAMYLKKSQGRRNGKKKR